MELVMKTQGGRTVTLSKDKFGFVYLELEGENQYGNIESCHVRLLPESVSGDEVETLRDLLSAIRN